MLGKTTIQTSIELKQTVKKVTWIFMWFNDKYIS